MSRVNFGVSQSAAAGTEIAQCLVKILETLPKTALAEMIFPVNDDNSLVKAKTFCLTKLFILAVILDNLLSVI